MIDIESLDKVVGWMQEAGLEVLTVEERGVRLSLHLDGAAPTPTAPPEPALHTLTSLAMGRFVAAHPRRPDRHVQPGQRIAAGEIVGYLKSGPTLTAIASDKAGTVAELLVADGDLTGFGTPILTLTTD